MFCIILTKTNKRVYSLDPTKVQCDIKRGLTSATYSCPDIYFTNKTAKQFDLPNVWKVPVAAAPWITRLATLGAVGRGWTIPDTAGEAAALTGASKEPVGLCKDEFGVGPLILVCANVLA